MRRCGGLLLVTLAASPALSAADSAPRNLQWAIEALARTSTPLPANAPAEVLLDEVTVTPLGNSGDSRFHRRTVLRVLTSEGQGLSLYPIEYSATRRLAWFRGWTIRPGGQFEPLDPKRTVDVALSDLAIYSDARQMLLPLRNVGVGSAIAIEYQLERSDRFLQEMWGFQWPLPVAVSRFVLDLPRDWQIDAKILNALPFEPVHDGDRLIWELRALPGLLGNDWSAPISDSSAQLALSYFPRSASGAVRTFRNWGEVAGWYHGLVTPQAKADPAIRLKIQELTAGVTDPLDRIRALAAHAQSLRYCSVSLGLSAYQPHSSVEVYKNRYGDCKDKATLLKTFLAETGLESFLLLVNTRVEGRVFPEFPSPLQFNHAILAIPLPEGAALAPVTEAAGVGRLLVFDPTDERTPLGDLPYVDQGTQALLVHPQHGGLVDLPILPSGANTATRTWSISMIAGGGAVATLSASYTGQYARLQRARLAGKDQAARLADLGASMSRIAGARIASASFPDLEGVELPARIEARMEVARFGRLNAPLHLTNPLGFLDSLAPILAPDPRGRPLLLLFPFVEHDRVTLTPPSGWRISELPPAREGRSEIGSFSVRFTVEEGALVAERNVTLTARDIPLDGHGAARAFLEDLARATGVTVVLERA